MELKEFMETDIYKNAGYYCYVGMDGEELEESEEELLTQNVKGYYMSSGGCLEITMDI